MWRNRIGPIFDSAPSIALNCCDCKPIKNPFELTTPVWFISAIGNAIAIAIGVIRKSRESYTMKSLARRTSSWWTRSGRTSRSSFASCASGGTVPCPWRRSCVTCSGSPRSSRTPSTRVRRPQKMPGIRTPRTRMIPSDTSTLL